MNQARLLSGRKDRPSARPSTDSLMPSTTTTGTLPFVPT